MSKSRQLSTTQLATHFRASNRLGMDDPINLIQLMYSIDVITVFKPLSSGFSGMVQKTGEHKFMLINSKHSLAKQNFTICHELYHLYYHKKFESLICNSGEFDKTQKEEYRADCFAADLLIPEFGILNEIPPEEARFNSITLPTLLRIENKYRCSRSALLFRLKIKKMIDSEVFDTFNKNVLRGASENGYSSQLYKPTNQKLEVIGKYGDIARKKYDRNEISESHYISLLQDIGIDLDESITDYVD